MLAFSHSDSNFGLANGKLNGRRRRSKKTPGGIGTSAFKGEKAMGDKGGRKVKGKKEQQRDAKLTLKEKRKLKKEKKA